MARITERAMQGELDFSGALRERVRLLAGLDQGALGRCLDERVRVTSGAETLVQTMRAGGASCLLVSGGFLSFAEPVARTVGFDRVQANRLVFAGGKLSGEVGDPIVDAMAKRDALVEARDQLGLEPDDVLGVGDGANDKLMIEEAGLGIAFRAKPALAEVADAELRHHGLDACCGSRASGGATGSAADYFAATTKQAWPLSAPQAAPAAARDSNGPACRRVMVPTGM